MNVRSFAELQDILIESENDENTVGSAEFDEYDEEFEEEEVVDEDFNAQNNNDRRENYNSSTPVILSTPPEKTMTPSSVALFASSHRSETFGKVVEFTFDEPINVEASNNSHFYESMQSSSSPRSEKWEDEDSGYQAKVLAELAAKQRLPSAVSPKVIISNNNAIAAKASIKAAVTVVSAPMETKTLLNTVNSALYSHRHPLAAVTVTPTEKTGSSTANTNNRLFSKVHKASAHEIPGYKENNSPSSNTARNFISTPPTRHAVIASIASLLNAATATHQDNTIKKNVIAKGAIAVPVLKTGLTKVQALQATGRFFHEDIADFDPDYEEALGLLPDMEAQYRAHAVVGDSRRSMGANEVHQQSPLSAAMQSLGRNCGIDRREPVDDQAYVESSRGKKDLHSPIMLSQEYIPSQSFHHSRPSTVQPPTKCGARDVTAIENGSNTARRLITPSFASSVRHMPSASLTREESLRKLTADPSERADIASRCENVYATFLGDIIGVCKMRAETCTNPQEMAMLRALSLHVSEAFAGSNVDSLQGKMIAAASSASRSLE